MVQFKELSKEKVSNKENKISDFWEKIGILHKTIENREGKDNFVFYEGPPTANGHPGIHHVLSRVLKDTVCKYKTMEGYRVLRKAGWDTHGLPVEIEVEKQLGLSSKPEIEEYGIHKFNTKCKESVFTYESEFRDMTKKMGYFIDLENPYITLENDYIETEWWILKKFFDEGLIYEGHKILPFCSRCGTGLASHEVAQGYKEIKSETVIVPMKLVGKNEYFLVWTTTPWTLMSNVAIAVNPKESYVKVKSKGNIFYVAENLVSKVLGEEYELLEKFKGTNLEYLEYEQLIPTLKTEKKAFYVVLADYVTTDDGTGLVHIAPAFGEDDYQIGRKYNLPVLNPVSEDGKYLEGPWEGMFVMDADPKVVKYLKEKGKLFKKERIPHNYPHCWRCGTPLLYYAKPSWYIEMTKLKELLIENNNSVNWYPSFVGEKRFGNWLENLNDWAISRSRYWGTPLNIWRCECGHLESLGSRKELAEKAIEDIDENIELHRPYVDDVHIKCPKCNKEMTRVKDVIDCWFDSGSMPFAQYHYPFENKELFEDQYPSDFICEGIDQTRGWFYSLLAISTFVLGKSPYKNVLVNDLLLDKNGRKMSKSKGNSVDPFEMFDTYGADALRWYLLYVSPAWTSTKFDEDGLKDVQSKFFNTIKNVYTFFALYANTDNLNPKEFFVEYKERPEIDRWLLSKYNKLLKEVYDEMKVFDLTKAVRKIQFFINEDLSNWYIRRNRRRFWGSELDKNKKAVYNTTYEVLEGLTRLIAPYVPFISEEIYQNLTGKESVHLADLPTVNEDLIVENIEYRMDLVRNLISLGRSAREEATIKVRQPVSKIIIDGKFEKDIYDLTSLIKEELNVKDVIFEKDLDKYMNFIVKPNFKVAGKIIGKNMRAFSQELASKDQKEFIQKLERTGQISLSLNGDDYKITKELIDIKISSKEGFNVQMNKNLFVILDTNLTEELIKEGHAREIVSKIQQLRKSSGFDVSDKIYVYFNSDDEINNVIDEYAEYIKNETLTIELINNLKVESSTKVNGHELLIDVKKC